MTHSYRYRLLTLALACAAVAACSQEPAPTKAKAAAGGDAIAANVIDNDALAGLDPQSPVKAASGALVAVANMPVKVASGVSIDLKGVTYSGLSVNDCSALVEELVATGEFAVMDFSIPKKGALIINEGRAPDVQLCNRMSNTVGAISREAAPPTCLVDAAVEFGIPRDLMRAILVAELPPYSRTHMGQAFGPLGLSSADINRAEASARIIGGKTDECQNYRAGAWLLADMITREKGDLWKGLERYYGNAKIAANVRATAESAQ